MNEFLMCCSGGACLLLSFLLFFHPLRENLTANKWLAVFVFIMGIAFLSVYFDQTAIAQDSPMVIKWIKSLQFLLAPSLLLSTLFFADPIKVFDKRDWLHFMPFFVVFFIQVFFVANGIDLMNQTLFEIGTTTLLVRDLLPIQLLIYLWLSYRIIVKHNKNLKLITASVSKINLDWLQYFLFILGIILLFWLNDALFGIPFLLKVMPIIYAGSIFFLAYFSMQQRAVFDFNQKELKEIGELLAIPQTNNPQKNERLSNEQFELYAEKLNKLMIDDQLFLDNKLSLPTLANKLAISIHDTSYLINKLTNSNFYNFINQHRVAEAKRLLISDRMDELNMLGIAFAAGFNSKTAFNTAFKKQVGISPTMYANSHKKP